MQPSGLSEQQHDYSLGQQLANELIDKGVDVARELAAADTLWNRIDAVASVTELSWMTSMCAGLRDTLREYAQRGDEQHD